jgi:cullin-4
VNEIVRGVRRILSSPIGSDLEAGTGLETLYLLTERTVLASSQSAENLYDRIKLELERGIGDLASSLRSGPSSQTTEASLLWLQRLIAAWQSWCEKATLIGSILTVLNQSYLLEQSGHLSLWDLCLDLFLVSIVQNDDLQSHTVDCIIACVNVER